MPVPILDNFFVKFWTSVLVLCAFFANSQEFSFEMADTHETRSWGLMGRRELAEDHGMLFDFEYEHCIKLWSFNCFMDLSVAFLDSQGVIVDIQPLRSFPRLMHAFPTIRDVNDLQAIDWTHPNIDYYQKHGIRAKQAAQFALEMPLGWFQRSGIRIGDQVQWNPKTGRAKIATHHTS